MNSQEFRDFIRLFTSSHDPVQHRTAILSMLDPLDLDIEFKKLASEGDLQRVANIFSSFSDSDDEESLSEYEQSRLEQVGTLTRQYFEQKAYSSFALMIYQLLLESFLEKYDLGSDDVNLVSTQLLYQRLPEEIHLQTFLIENMANQRLFNWNRDDQIVMQSLFVLTVCFSDVYAFLVDDEEWEEDEFIN